MRRVWWAPGRFAWVAVAVAVVLGCSNGSGGSLPIPDITDPTCGWVERAVLAFSECMMLTAQPGYETRFLADGDTSCSGVSCLVLQVGESAVVLGPLTELQNQYRDTPVDCSAQCSP